jgi:hypothetical protein
MLQKQLLLLSLLLTLSVAYAQQRITVSVQAQPLSQVLAQLTRTYAIDFAYSSDQVDLDKKVTVSFENKTPEEALKKIFANTGIAYSISGNLVALYRDENYRVTISGTIREKGTGELLIGVIIGADPPKSGAVSNAYGFYSLTLPPGEYVLHFNYIGFQPYSKKITLDQSQELNLELIPATSLSEVVVNANQQNDLHTNAFTIRLQEINSIPMILGERDVVKYAMLAPGVQKGNEGNSYMYVRGGGPDQNLILIDDATIYNAYHFLGLASLFSGAELRNAELIKGGFSSKYGGRLSSVLDMSMKDGNREKLGIDATVGGISSRLMIEGPIVKNKSSFLISGRRSYINKVSGWIAQDDSKALNYGFYDLHAKISTDMGRRDRLMLSAYLGHDAMQTNAEENVSAKDDGISWGNRAASLRWSHQFSGKLFANTSLVHSYYNSRMAFAETDGASNITKTTAIQSAINDIGLKTDLDFLPSPKHRFRFGSGFTRHYFAPVSSIHYNNPDSSYEKNRSHPANEAYGYAEWNFHFAAKWLVTSGLRLSYYQNQVAYKRAEPRLNLEYTPFTDWTFNTSYALMNQYMHLLSTFNGFGFPNDVWVSSDEHLKPQQSHLVTLGMRKKNIANGLFSFTAEGYYKLINNAVDMKENQSLFNLLVYGDNTNTWSEITTQGTGRSYGMEYMLRKEGKQFTGWISYTLSRTTMQFDALNSGNPFPATYDRRHDIGVYLSYRLKKHWKFSTNFVYGTGNAISLPVGEYYAYGSGITSGFTPAFPLLDYEKKNSYRMKPYNRLDIAIQYDHLIAKKIRSTIEFSIYNVYNRANPFFYQIEQQASESGPGTRKLQQISLFPIMPSISWSIKI